MFQRISRLSLLCSILVLGSVSSLAPPEARYLRHASCSTCNKDSPGALSSPWYGAPEEEDSRRDNRGLEPFRKPSFPPRYPYPQEDGPREIGNYGYKKPIDFFQRNTHPYPITPATPLAPRPGGSVSPNVPRFPPRYPEEHRPRDFSPDRDFPRRFEANTGRNYPSRDVALKNGHYFVQKDRSPFEGIRRFRSERPAERTYPEAPPRFRQADNAREVSRRFRNEEPSLEPRVQSEHSEEESEEGPVHKNPRFRNGVVVRPRTRQVQPDEGPREQLRKDRSREAEILRVTQITIDPEASDYSEEVQPDLSVLRFSPESAKASRPYLGGWEEEEYVDVKKETPFGMSEMISVNQESMGPGGFEEDRYTEEIDSLGWGRQANPSVVIIQSRETRKDDAEGSTDEPAEEAVMKIAPRLPKDKNSGKKEFEVTTNPDFYGDIEYPPTNGSESVVQERATEKTTASPDKHE